MFVLSDSESDQLDQSKHPFSLAAFFPWTPSDRNILSPRFTALHSVDFQSRWDAQLATSQGLLAMAVGSSIHLLRTYPADNLIPLSQIDMSSTTHNITALAWSILPHTLDPVLLFASNNVLYVWDISKNTRRSALAGHGAPITSIAVSKSDPGSIASSSRDFTIRIWDLCVQAEPSGLVPPPLYSRCHGPGSCTSILHGNMSGGHCAPVLHVDFHPSLPLLASLDRAVKIWLIRPATLREPGNDLLRNSSPESCRRPVFSSTHVHPSGICAVKWLSEDVLITQSLPMPTSRIAKADASVRIWRWLGYSRLKIWEENVGNNDLFGCIGDYKDSGSFHTLGILAPPNTKESTAFLLAGTSPTIILPTNIGFICTHLSTAVGSGTEEPTPSQSKTVHQNVTGDKLGCCAVSPDGKTIVAGGESIHVWRWKSETRT